MCCGGETQKTSSTTQAPKWLLDTYKRLLGRAEDQSETPYQAYTGQRVADFTPDQLAAFQSVRDTQGAAQPYFDAAFQSAQQGAGPVTWQQVEAAYNPTIDSQIQRLQDDFAYRNAQENARTSAMATNAGAITGDRAQVARVLTEESQRRSQDPVLAQLRTDAYNRAWQGAEGNRDAAAKGSQIYSNLGTAVQSSLGEDIQRLLATGGAQQQNQQANYDWGYQQYLNQLQYPYQNIQWASGIAGMGPSFGMTSTGSTTSPDSTLGNIAGLGATVLGGWLGSDERVKENIVPIGTAHDGQTIYRFNYVGDPTTHIGFLAQEVEETHPEAVREGPDGLKEVNYDLATRDSLGGPSDPLLAPEAPLPSFPHVRGEGGFAYGGPIRTRQGDEDFGRLVSKVGSAVETLKGHMQGGRAGYAAGGLTVPTATLGDVKPDSIIPTGNLGTSAPAQLMQPPSVQGGDDSAAWGTLNKGAAQFGKWLGSPDPTDPASWKTTVTPAARGGVMSDLESDDPLRGLGVPPIVKADSSFASPKIAQAARPSGVAGISVEGAPSGSRDSPRTPERVLAGMPTSEIGDAYSAPQASAPAETLPPPSQTLGGSPSGTDLAWYEPDPGKGYLDPNSNPDLGMALSTAGAAMMGNKGSFFSKLGRGVGTGIGSYLARADAERRQGREDLEMDLRAAQLEDAAKLRQIQAQKAQFDLDQAKAGRIIEVDKKAFLLKPDGTVETIYGGNGSDLGEWENIKDKNSAEEGLRKEFHALPTVKDFMTMRDAYNRVVNSAENPDAAGDIALIYAYMKILDPGSVVRETEFATAQNAAGVPDQIRNTWNKLLQGTRLGPEESRLRTEFVDRARKLYEGQKGQYEAVRNYYGQIAERQQLDPENVLVDHTRPTEGKEATDRALRQASDMIKRGVPRDKVYDALRKDGIDPKLMEQ